MFETMGLNGLSEEDFYQEASDLEAQGYRRVDRRKELQQGQYSFTSYSGSQHDFGEDKRYNLKWMPF